jgi:ElaB/YqjD/DUF883 family membrane-anchored ribosome-binding protein
MSRNAQPKVTEGDFTHDHSSAKSYDIRQAATQWAGTMKESVRDNLVKAGYQTETYVRKHPGRFIAGACCVGLTAGWLLSRATKKS